MVARVCFPTGALGYSLECVSVRKLEYQRSKGISSDHVLLTSSMDLWNISATYDCDLNAARLPVQVKKHFIARLIALHTLE